MRRQILPSAVALSVLLVGIACWWMLQPSSPSTERHDLTPPTDGSRHGRNPVGQAVQAKDQQSSEVTAPPPAAPATDRTGLDTGRLAVSCVGSDGNAIVGCDIAVIREIPNDLGDEPVPTPECTGRSNAHGTWECRVSRHGTYTVTASARGYVPASRPGAVAESEVPIVLQPGIRFLFAVVEEGSRQPVPSGWWQVSYVNVGGNQERLPFEPLRGVFKDGKFELCLPDAHGRGDPVLSVGAPGLRTVGTKVAWEDVAPLEKEIQLKPPVTVEGRVVEAGTGLPVGGACVYFWQQPLQVAEADADGRFRGQYAGLQTQEIAICVQAAGHKEAWVRAPVREDGKTASVTVEVSKGIDIEGQVVDEASRAPVTGARVQVWKNGDQRGYMVRKQATTDTSGGFRFSGLDPAEVYDITIEADGYAIRVAQARTGENATERLHLGPITVRKGVTVRGRVVRKNGTGIPGAKVSFPMWGIADVLRFQPVEYSILAKPSTNIPQVAFAVTDEKGWFVVDGITPGARQVVATDGAGKVLYDSYALVVPGNAMEWKCEIVAE